MTIHGKDTGLCLAEFDLTRWCNEVSSDGSVDVAEASCFDEPEGAKVYVVGLNDATFSWAGREQGNITPGLRGTVDALGMLDAGVPFTVAIDRGFHVGRLAQMGTVYTTAVNLSAPIGDVVSVSGDLQADGGTVLGRVLTQKLPYEATVQGPSVNLLTPSVEARIHYHVTANDHNGQVIVTVQHSDDGSTWVDLNQFVVEGGEQLADAVVVSAPIDQYVRAVVSLAGTAGTATVRVAIAVRK